MDVDFAWRQDLEPVKSRAEEVALQRNAVLEVRETPSADDSYGGTGSRGEAIESTGGGGIEVDGGRIRVERRQRAVEIEQQEEVPPGAATGDLRGGDGGVHIVPLCRTRATGVRRHPRRRGRTRSAARPAASRDSRESPMPRRR